MKKVNVAQQNHTS